MNDKAVAVREEEPRAIVKIRTALQDRTQDLLAVLPDSMGGSPEKRVERFMRVSLMAVSKNPEILACTPSSIVRSIIEAAEVGLEPTGSLNRAWLVGFRANKDAPKEAMLMIGYQGYADLMRDSGRVKRVTAEVVYEGDLFRVIKGTEQPRIEHEPAYATEDPSKITYAYAIAWFGDGTYQSEVMSRAQIELIRAKSRQRNGPAWTQGYPQMCRKSTIRRLANYVPLSARAASAIARDDEAEFGPAHVEGGESRTATVKASIAARLNPGKAATPVQNDLQQPAEPEVDVSSSPDVSASQPTESDTTADPVAASEVCGATSDPALGDVLTCVLQPGHAFPDGKASGHQSVEGSKFPNKARS